MTHLEGLLHEKITDEVFRTEDPRLALDRASAIYAANVEKVREAAKRLSQGASGIGETFAFYPFISVPVEDVPARKMREFQHHAFGFARRGRGLYYSTITQPETFRAYLEDQLGLFCRNHDGAPILVGQSRTRIPVRFLLEQIAVDLSAVEDDFIRDVFGEFTVLDLVKPEALPDEFFPLAQYEAVRTDYSLLRLLHYTGTPPEVFQRFVLLTNYAMYLKDFLQLAEELVADPASGYTGVEASRALTGVVDYFGLPSMPAVHLKRADGNGVSIINIGVGASNAKNIMDNLAVLRPHAVLMVGHCGGLRETQELGEYVLVRGVLRDDRVTEETVPLYVPVDSIGHLDQGIRQGVSEICGIPRDQVKTLLENGVIASTYDRCWEISHMLVERYLDSGAAAIDMETATILAMGKKHQIPCSALLCISDVPVAGKFKLPGMAQTFYASRVKQHLRIAFRVMELVRENPEDLHSRKLRTIHEPPLR